MPHAFTHSKADTSCQKCDAENDGDYKPLSHPSMVLLGISMMDIAETKLAGTAKTMRASDDVDVIYNSAVVSGKVI